MNHPRQDSPDDVEAVQERLLLESLYASHCRTDRLFAGLLAFQWIAGIAAALIITPRTWIGSVSQPHVHVMAAVFLGGAIVIAPIMLALLSPGRTLTRHVVALSQMLASALLIHLSGGRIETHFHVFGSLAFLAFYRDWRVLATATAVVVLDHCLRGIYWPQSVFGDATSSNWRWVEHAAWVVFIDIFLLRSCLQGVVEMKEAARRESLLIATSDNLFSLAGRVRATAIEVAADSRQVNSTANSISLDANQQTVNVQQIVDAMEQVANAIAKTSESAIETNHIATATAEQTAQGGIAVTQAMKSMEMTSDRIKVIQNIADSTELLALNAEVEAARVGAAGLGFAVVATEVRKLAEVSRNAADEIKDSTRETAESAQNARRLLDDIVPRIQETSRLVNRIAEDSQAERKRLEDMRHVMTNLDQTAHRNAASSHELLATASVMDTHAYELEAALEEFRARGRASEQGLTPDLVGFVRTRETWQPYSVTDMNLKIQLYSIAVILTISAGSSLAHIYFHVGSLARDGVYVNQAGRVRGLSQRLAKLKLARERTNYEELQAETTGNLASLTQAMKGSSAESAIVGLELGWEQLQRALQGDVADPEVADRLIYESEQFFQVADKAVEAVRGTGRSRVDVVVGAQFALFTLSIVIVMGVLVVTRNVANALRRTIDEVSTASYALEETVGKQERVASEQAIAMSETSTTVEELGASSRLSAEQAESAAADSLQALELTSQGSETVSTALEGIQQLHEHVTLVARQINGLSDQVGQIDEISRLVGDLSRRTNMLALNAAVEAAHAGEHGKGFGVVASEIRKLADESGGFVDEIRKLVTDIQEATHAAVLATDEGRKSVLHGRELTRQTSDVFQRIGQSINAASDSVQQISLNIREQASAINQVAEATESLNDGAQLNANTVQQTGLNVQGLNESMRKLRSLMESSNGHSG